MKQLLILCLAVMLGCGAINAQKKTSVFKADIKCNNCAQKIMDNVPMLGEGIEDVKVDVDAKTVTVTYDSSKNTDENIIKGFSSMKVEAKPACAEPYCKMPPVKATKGEKMNAQKMGAIKLDAKKACKDIKAEVMGECDHKGVAKTCGQDKQCDHKGEAKACGQGKHDCQK